MIWDIIPKIGTPIALIAFVLALVFYYLRSQLKNKLDLIKSAPTTERADLIERTLGDFNIDADTLTREQKYDLLKRKLDSRSQRFRLALNFSLVLSLSVLMAFVVLPEFVGNQHKTKTDELATMRNPAETALPHSGPQSLTPVKVEPSPIPHYPDSPIQTPTNTSATNCFVKTGLMTGLYNKPTLFTGTKLRNLPQFEKYAVIKQQVYHHGPMDVLFFRIKDADGTEGWVKEQELEEISPGCLE